MHAVLLSSSGVRVPVRRLYLFDGLLTTIPLGRSSLAVSYFAVAYGTKNVFVNYPSVSAVRLDTVELTSAGLTDGC